MANTSPDPAAQRNQEFMDLFRKATAGDPEASQALFTKFAPCFLKAIRGELPRDSPLRPFLDSEVFLQELQVKLLELGFTLEAFDGPAAFLAYVTRMAENLVKEAKRKYLVRPEANRSREQSLEALRAAQWDFLAAEADQPVDVCIAEDEWRHALESLPLVYRYIAIKLREGSSHTEIANALNISVRMVGRVVFRLRQHFGLEPAKQP
jgi:DNA-directed RNA polymerase specialized sigma24 family protein